MKNFLVLLCLVVAGCSNPVKIPQSEKELYKSSPKNVQKFYDYCLKNRYKVDLADLTEIIYVCENAVPILSGGRYSPLDVMAIIMQESRFNKDAIGTMEEVGLCQILTPNMYLHFLGEYDPAVAFDIKNNVIMACLVLNIKFFHFKNYKESIAAYNSIGNVSYYKGIMKNKKILKKFFNEDLKEAKA